MGPKRKPAGERRQEILAAAESLFVVRGFDAVTMDDIARAAGLARPTLYEYYQNKEALLSALIDRLMSQAPDLAVAEGSCRERLTALAAAQLGFIQEHRVVYRLVFQKLPSLSGPVAARVAERQQAQGLQVMAAVTEAAAAGEVRAELGPGEVMFAFQALVGQMGTVLLMTDRVIDPAGEAARLVDLLWRGVGA